MIIDTDKLDLILDQAASITAALQALRNSTTTEAWDALSETPELEALLDACSDLEYTLQE